MNDTYGRDDGDFLLNAIAQRLSATTRIEDMVAVSAAMNLSSCRPVIWTSRKPKLSRNGCAILSAPLYFKEVEIFSTSRFALRLRLVTAPRLIAFLQVLI